jgi:hypothetical protein
MTAAERGGPLIALPATRRSAIMARMHRGEVAGRSMGGGRFICEVLRGSAACRGAIVDDERRAHKIKLHAYARLILTVS